MSVKKDIIKISKNTPESDFAVFLDRDGVINEEVHLLHRVKDLKIIKGSAETIAKLNKLKIPVFLISNQTVLARGLTTHKEFNKIHQKLISLLRNMHAHFDGVIYCLHSEKADLKEYRKVCPFRKPSPGMIFEIEKRLNKVFSQTFVIGDQARDILMANKAKAIGILVKTGHGGKDVLYEADPDIIAKDFEQAFEIIFNIIKNKDVSAIILAGGKGTRLKSLTENFQKVMLNIGNKPIIDWQIQNLARSGITKINITLCHQPHSVTSYLNNRYQGLSINAIIETTPKGTAGSLLDIKDRLSENFFVIYGDVLNSVNLSNILNFHIKKNALGTLVVRRTDHPQDSDLIVFNRNLKVEKIFSKPHNKPKGYGNTGIMIFNKKILKSISKSNSLDFMKDIIPLCFSQKKLFAYPLKETEYVKDIGTPDRYNQALIDFEKGKIKNV